MKKKFLLTGAAVMTSAAILALASCSSESGEQTKKVRKDRTGDPYHFVEAPAAPTYDTDGGEVDVCLNYAGTSGVSRAESDDTLKDPITQEQLTAGKILPTWEAFGKYTRTTILEATDYVATDDKSSMTAFESSTKSKGKDTSREIDLFYNTTDNIKKKAAKFAALNEFINVEHPEQAVMKNFSAYLKSNPSIMKQLQIGSNGEIYYTPYFDGVDDIERMFVMDTTLTKKVLDSTSGWDNDSNKLNGGTTAAANLVQGGFYQPFMDANKNYSSAQTVKVVVNNAIKSVAVVETTNIIKQQNQLLETGCTGQQLAEQFITYIKAAYKNFFDEGVYTNPSDLFISGAAAYNTDDLIALMRVVKANPGMITGNPDAEIETFFPRAVSTNRLENIYDIAQIWGVQGVDGENKNFYFGSDGKCHALETTKQSYDALQYLSEIYDEGLIKTDFWNGTKSSTGELDRYFKKTADNSAYGFMMYDFSAATTAANDLEEGVGTPTKSRRNGFGEGSGYECKGITPIIAPLTYWATESNWDQGSDITDRTGKTLTRYYESNRAIKKNSWAISANSDNKAGAARLMDFMFSKLGQLVNNYGPTDYWAIPDTEIGDTIDGEFDANKVYVTDNIVLNELNPAISSYIKLGVVSSGKDFWTYSREVLGSTHGIGNIRPAGVNLQVTNKYGQVGVKNIQTAFTVNNNNIVGNGEALKLATFTKEYEDDGSTKFTWDTCVPSGYAEAPEVVSTFNATMGFWNPELTTETGWIAAVSRGHDMSMANISVKDSDKNVTTYAKVWEQMEAFNKTYLYGYAKNIGANEKYVPDYAK